MNSFQSAMFRNQQKHTKININITNTRDKLRNNGINVETSWIFYFLTNVLSLIYCRFVPPNENMVEAVSMRIRKMNRPYPTCLKLLIQVKRGEISWVLSNFRKMGNVLNFISESDGSSLLQKNWSFELGFTFFVS